MNASVLVIDDDQSMCELLQDALAIKGYQIEWRLRADEGLSLLRERDFDVVITDVNLDSSEGATGALGVNGIDLCRNIVENRPNTPVIVITAFGNMSSAIAAMHAGAHDFVNKPIDMAQLEQGIERVLRLRNAREKVRRLRQESVLNGQVLSALSGQCRAMLDIYDMIRRVANTDTTVLLCGESGTGKELVARALHEEGGRAQQPFVALNCAAVPAPLLEAELFGHVKGAFTDAKASRAGLFEQAGSGTLLLDEIGEMPLEMQPKLLRVLQERQFRPVGGNTVQPMHARIVAATNRDLEREVSLQRFREDLYYRLNVVQIRIPPLRARGNDILLLARHFVGKYAERMGKHVTGISPEAAAKLLEYDWPGNVRQLENSMECAVALTHREQLGVEDLPERIHRHDGGRVALTQVDAENTLTLAQVERNHIERALRAAKWNKTLAAKTLGVDRRTLYRKLERYHGIGQGPASIRARQEERA